MRASTLTHVPDEVLLRDLADLVVRERVTTADLLAHIAEVDTRRLYAPAGHPSMFAYCVDRLGLSEDAAYKRIQAARAARQFPLLLAALADGRLHLAALCLLAPHLTGDNVEELVAATSFKRKSAIEQLLARRPGPGPASATGSPGAGFGASPRPSAMPIATIRRLPGRELAPGQVEASAPTLLAELAASPLGGSPGEFPESGAPGASAAPSDVSAAAAAPSDMSAAVAVPEHFLLKVAIDRSTHDKLRYAQALLSHSVRAGDVAEVLERALDALVRALEKRKFAATSRPRPGKSAPRSRRCVPAGVRRAVWARDQGQCTFVNEEGRRCEARRLLEFDHVDPVARGGRPTVERMRLRCRTHNQYEAERAFGREFMNEKRRRSGPDPDPGLTASTLARSRARQAATDGAGGAPEVETAPT